MFFDHIHTIGAIVALVLFGIILTGLKPASEQPPDIPEEENEFVIVGGGHIGLIEALHAYLRAEKNGQKIRITIFEKDSNTEKTTAANIWNSHTPDEIVAVVPRGKDLEEKLTIAFNKPGGIRVDDVPGINDSKCTECFINEVRTYGKNEKGHERRTNALLRMGGAGMALWKACYEKADNELRAILKSANFNYCYEVASNEQRLRQGYRIDLIYDMPNAKEHAANMAQSYIKLGFKNCRTLSPDEVVARDSSLAQFCNAHSTGKVGERQWKDGSIALWRPGGCLDTQSFLPKLVTYLKKAMGTYRGTDGKLVDRFQIHYNKKVTGVIFDDQKLAQATIKGLKFGDDTEIQRDIQRTTYIFCPGESVGTLTKLGFQEPAYAGFAGASLCINLPLSEKQLKDYEKFGHYMEVHKVGVVIAWQARIRDGNIFLGGAGTKAYYADKVPTIHDAFAKDRNVLQLQMFNDVLPWVMSLALNRDTTGQKLTAQDLAYLEEKGIAKRWVGLRAVTYDGFPTLGRLYYQAKVVVNARVTTHLGSGGGSFAHIVTLISSYSLNPKEIQAELDSVNLDSAFIQEVLGYADSRRKAMAIDVSVAAA